MEFPLQTMEFRDDEHYATHRSSMLARDLDLRPPEAEAIAYCERGYSWSGAAREMDSSRSTVKSYVERAICLYGFEIAESTVTMDDAELPQYERVEPEYFKTRTETDAIQWITLILDYEESLPAEFVEDVRAAALDSGMFPRADS